MVVKKIEEESFEPSDHSETESFAHLTMFTAQLLRGVEKGHPKQSLSERDVRHIKESVDE